MVVLQRMEDMHDANFMYIFGNAKDYEVATERVHEAKLERIGNLVLPLKFYLESFKGESCNDGK